jgi:hypothetical protein
MRKRYVIIKRIGKKDMYYHERDKYIGKIFEYYDHKGFSIVNSSKQLFILDAKGQRCYFIDADYRFINQELNSNIKVL